MPQSFGSADFADALEDEEESRPAKAARSALGFRRSSLVQGLPECKALHKAVLQPAMAYVRAGMHEKELQVFRVRACRSPLVGRLACHAALLAFRQSG